VGVAKQTVWNSGHAVQKNCNIMVRSQGVHRPLSNIATDERFYKIIF